MKKETSQNIFFKLAVVAGVFLGLAGFVSTARAAVFYEQPGVTDASFLVVYTMLYAGDSTASTTETILTLQDLSGTVITTTTIQVGEDQAIFRINPGEYRLIEEPLPGYVVSYKDDQTDLPDDTTDDGVDTCNTDGTVTAPIIPDGMETSAICTIAQRYITYLPTTSTLQINEVVINDNGDTKTVDDFPFDLSINGVTTTYPGVAATTTVLSVGDTYNVDLTVPGSYAKSLSGDCSGTVSQPGGTLVCTITLDDQELFLIDVRAEAIDTTSAKVMWTTSHAGASRVIYDPVSHDATTTPPLYGYAFTTNEQDELVTNHEMIITGLEPDTVYYFRAISHGSPEVVSNQVSARTLALPAGGGQNFGVGPGSGTSGPSAAPAPAPAPAAPAPAPAAPQAVLGEKIEAPLAVAPSAPQAVLGFETLPATGGDNKQFWLYALAVACITLGSGLIVASRQEW